MNCRNCTEQVKDAKRCEGGEENIRILDITLKQCPVKETTKQSLAYIQAYSFYKAGFLPSEGCAMEQGMKMIEAINFIDHVLEKLREEKNGR